MQWAAAIPGGCGKLPPSRDASGRSDAIQRAAVLISDAVSDTNINQPRSPRSQNSRTTTGSLVLALAIAIRLISTVHLPAQSALAWSSDDRAQFEQLPVVSVATDATWPPMEFINRDRELVGFDIDLLREIGLRTGFQPVFETVPWEGIFAGLAAGSYDMIASSVTLLEERRARMRFSRPYFRAAQYVVVRANQDQVATLADLAGSEVGAQIATTGSRLIAATPGLTLRAYDDLGLAVEDLANGRLGGIVADSAIVQHYVLGNERYGRLLRVVDQPYAVEPYAFAIRLDRPDLERLVNEGLASVEADGTLDEIYRFWFTGVPGDE